VIELPNWQGRKPSKKCPDCGQREVALKTLVGDTRFLICPVCQKTFHKSLIKELKALLKSL